MQTTTKYYLFHALFSFGMGAHATAYAPYLLSIGLTLGQIGLVNAFFWGTIILAELPTGMLADGRSRSWSLKMAGIFLSFGALIYTTANGLWMAIAAEILIGISLAFESGAEQAWIADALHREGRESHLRKTYATRAMVAACANVLGGILGTGLALYSYRLIWIPFVITGFVASWLAHKQMNHVGEPMERVDERTALRMAMAHLRRSRELIWAIAAFMLMGIVVSYNHYWSVYFQSSVGTAGLAWVWALMYGSLFAAGWMVRRREIHSHHENAWVIFSIVLAGTGILALSTMQGGVLLPLSAVIVHEIGRGIFFPLNDAYVQQRVQSAYRATFGSLQSFLGRGGPLLTSTLVWLFIRTEPNTTDTIVQVWLFTGSIMIAGAILLWLARPKR